MSNNIAKTFGTLTKSATITKRILKIFLTKFNTIFGSVLGRIKSSAKGDFAIIPVFNRSEMSQIVNAIKNLQPHNVLEDFDINPTQQFSIDMGFFLEYAIVYQLAVKTKVPILKRIGSASSGGKYVLMGESKQGDTYKIDEIMELIKRANIFKTIKQLGKYYYSSKKDLLSKLENANERDKETFIQLFGTTMSLKEKIPLAKITDKLINSIGRKNIVAIAHAGDYTSALFKADFSIVYSEGGHDSLKIKHVSLKLYSDKAQMITILGARPYVFRYLIDNELEDAGYTSKSSRDAWIEEHGSKMTERDGKEINVPNVSSEDVKNTLDEFIKTLANKNASIEKILKLFKTIMHGQEGSEFLAFAKSVDKGLLEVAPDIEMIDPEYVEDIKIKSWGNGYAIEASYYDEDDVYHSDNIIILTPEEKKISLKFKIYTRD